VAAFEKLQREGDSVRYSFEDVRSQLFSVVKSLSSVYILIDDLDGMYHNQRRQLFRTLIDLVDPKSSPSVVKIMVSSRLKDDIPTSLGRGAPPSSRLARRRRGYRVLSYSSKSAYSMNKQQNNNNPLV
jgi:hypothetical protein